MNKVIITGPTGAIGVALIECLTKSEVEVTAICREGTKRKSNLTQNSRINQRLLSVIELDLCHIKRLPEVLAQTVGTKKYDVFYHFAWENTFGADARNDINAQLLNIQYTIDALEVAKVLECKRFVGAGSQAEHGRVEGKLSATTPVNPENAYGIAKLAAGQLSRIRAKQLNIGHIWTRVLSVYGPYDGENTMIMSLIRKLKAGVRPSLTDCEQKWDYLNSKDAALAFMLLGDAGISGKTYVIGSGLARPLKEYVEIIKNIIAPNSFVGYGDIEYSDNQVMYLEADIAELKEDTGFEVSVNFEEGIIDLISKS